jgi:hypothetical protein
MVTVVVVHWVVTVVVSVGVVGIVVAAGATVQLTVAVAESPFVSVATIVVAVSLTALPATVPETTPVIGLMTSPAGRFNAAYVTVAASVSLAANGTSTVEPIALDSVVGVVVGKLTVEGFAGAPPLPLIVQLIGASIVPPSAAVAMMIDVALTALLATVPEIVPLEGLIVTPAGRSIAA